MGENRESFEIKHTKYQKIEYLHMGNSFKFGIMWREKAIKLKERKVKRFYIVLEKDEGT